MPEMKLVVFIGSTKEDLVEYRAAVRAAITELGFFPEGMETWPVEDVDGVEMCRNKVKSADIYVGFYAYRYGWQPKNHNGKSITELEYDWAGEFDKPRLCFVVDDNFGWPDTKRDKKNAKKLASFKKRVKERIVGFFTTPDNLKAQVLAALPKQALPVTSTPTAKTTCIRLPAPPEYFAGRSAEMDKITKALQSDGTVAITAIRGIGGIGKTTLATKVAHEVDFGLKLWASLGKERRDEGVWTTLRDWSGKAFIEPGLTLEKAAAETKRILTETRADCGETALVVIDDVWADTVPAAKLLRQAVPEGTRVLITTRSEDVAIQLDARSQTLPFMPANEGADLILQHLNDARAEAHRAELEALSEILRGHPLALKLAARQLRRNFQPRRIQEMLDTLREGLEKGEDFKELNLHQGDQKEDSVSITLSQTLKALGGKSKVRKARRQKQFRALGALPADLPFRAEHALALWQEDEEQDDTPLKDALDDLAAEGLIEPVTTLEGEWYGQHRLLRAYARALLRQNGEFDDATERHRRYLIDRAYSVFAERRDKPETWGEITDDLQQIHMLGDELVALLTGTDDLAEQDWLLEKAVGAEVDVELRDVPFIQAATPDLLAACEDFADPICRYILRRYIGLEGRRWLWAGLVAAHIREAQGFVRLFTGELALWHKNRGYKQAAIAYNEQSLVICRELGDQWNEARTLNNIGEVWRALGDKEKALNYYEQALPLSQAVGDRVQEAVTLNNIGLVWSNLGEQAKALDYYEQALPLRQAVGDPYGEAVTRSNMAVILWKQGKRDEALQHMQTARTLKALIGMSTENEDGWLKYWGVSDANKED